MRCTCWTADAVHFLWTQDVLFLPILWSKTVNQGSSRSLGKSIYERENSWFLERRTQQSDSWLWSPHSSIQQHRSSFSLWLHYSPVVAKIKGPDFGELRIARPYRQSFSGHKSLMLNGKLIIAQISQCTKTQNPVEMRIKQQKQEARHSLY